MDLWRLNSQPTTMALWSVAVGRRFKTDCTASRNDPGQVVHTHAPLFTKQYKLVLTNGRWCSMPGKVTSGLASHWPCVTDSVVYPPTGSMAWEREMSTPPKLHWSTAPLPYQSPRGIQHPRRTNQLSCWHKLILELDGTTSYRDRIDGESIVRVVDKPVPDLTEITGVLVCCIHVHDKGTTFAVFKYLHWVILLQQCKYNASSVSSDESKLKKPQMLIRNAKPLLQCTGRLSLLSSTRW